MNFFKRNEIQPVVVDSQIHVGNVFDIFSTDDWNDITYTSVDALKNADVMSAINMIATDVAGLKVTTPDFQKDKDLLDLLNKKPNTYMNSYSLKYIIVANLILDGNVYIEVTRNDVGRAIQLDHISNDRVTIKKSRDNQRVKEVFYEVSNYDNKSIRKIKAQDMLHFKLLSTDGIVGQSPLKALQNELNVDKHSKGFLSSFFKNGTQSGGMLTTEEDLSPEAIKAVKEQFQQANAGVNNAHKVMVIPSGLKYDPLKVDTELIKLINDSNASKGTIASVLGIPLHKLGLSTSNMDLSQLNQDYLISTLKSYLDIILSELYKLDDNLEIEFDFNVDAYKNIDTKQMHENIKIERELGLITVDEARIKLGYKAIGGEQGKQLLTNLNFVDSSIANDYQLNKATSKGGE